MGFRGVVDGHPWHNCLVKASAVLSRNQEEIKLLCQKYGVLRLSLFGSALRDDWDPATSDFDFVAEFGAPPRGVNLFDQFFGFMVDLETLLGRSVDLVDWATVDRAIFREIVEESAVELYAA